MWECPVVTEIRQNGQALEHTELTVIVEEVEFKVVGKLGVVHFQTLGKYQHIVLDVALEQW